MPVYTERNSRKAYVRNGIAIRFQLKVTKGTVCVVRSDIWVYLDSFGIFLDSSRELLLCKDVSSSCSDYKL